MEIAVLMFVVALFVVWRVRKRRRAEFLADVVVYRGPKWRVDCPVVYWDSED